MSTHTPGDVRESKGGMMTELKHNHIPLPRGFYAMLCHRNGSPASEWDRMARLIHESDNVVKLLERFVNHLQSWRIVETAGGEMADARALLARIDGQE